MDRQESPNTLDPRERSPGPTTVLGRRHQESSSTASHPINSDVDSTVSGSAPRGALGTYRATDGSDGADVAIDFDRPHACLIVGKRGSGKSHTLGVLAEGLARTDGVVPIVLDPMGELAGLAELGLDTREEPTVRADEIPPPAWPSLVGLDPAGPAGTLVWQVADAADSLPAMRERVAETDATAQARRGARNHLRLAASWGVFDPVAPSASALVSDRGTVLDLSDLSAGPANAVCRAIAAGLYEWRTADHDDAGSTPLPWLLLDEAHAFFDGIADPALRRILTRGRTPGVSVVVATQQADLLLAHRLTAEPDVSALAAATPTYLDGTLRERLPRERGCAVVVDDATESVHGVRVRDRRSPHGGASPRASDRGDPESQVSDRGDPGPTASNSGETETTEPAGGDRPP